MSDLSEIEILRRAVVNAEYCLHPSQGGRQDPSRASQWLRTALPEKHPNYQDPGELEQWQVPGQWPREWPFKAS